MPASPNRQVPTLEPMMSSYVPNRVAWIALAFLAAAFGLGRLGLPGAVFALIAIAAAGFGLWIFLTRRPPVAALWLGLAVMAAMAIGPLLGWLTGKGLGPYGGGQLAFAVVIGVTVWAATLIPPITVRWSAIIVLALVSWAGLAAGVLAELGIVSYGLFYEPAQNREFLGLIQLRGVMPHPNTMGIFAGLAVALGVRQLITDYQDGTRRVSRYAILVLLVIMPSAFAVLWSQSRTSAISAGVGLLVALLPLQRASWRWVSTVIAAIAGLMVTVPVIVAEATGYNFNGRDFPWRHSQEVFESSPFIGGGPQYLTQWWQQMAAPPWKPETAHNMLMQAVGESGVVGLILLVALVAGMCVVAVRAVPYDRSWALIIVATFCLLGGQESSLSLPIRSALVVQFAILGASILATHRREEVRAGVVGGTDETDLDTSDSKQVAA